MSDTPVSLDVHDVTEGVAEFLLDYLYQFKIDVHGKLVEHAGHKTAQKPTQPTRWLRRHWAMLPSAFKNPGWYQIDIKSFRPIGVNAGKTDNRGPVEWFATHSPWLGKTPLASLPLGTAPWWWGVAQLKRDAAPRFAPRPAAVVADFATHASMAAFEAALRNKVKVFGFIANRDMANRAADIAGDAMTFSDTHADSIRCSALAANVHIIKTSDADDAYAQACLATSLQSPSAGPTVHVTDTSGDDPCVKIMPRRHHTLCTINAHTDDALAAAAAAIGSLVVGKSVWVVSGPPNWARLVVSNLWWQGRIKAPAPVQ